MIHATFFMEQHLGHQTLYQNLRAFLDKSNRIHPTWVPITYTGINPFIGQLPLLSAHLRGSLAGRLQVQRGLEVEPCDVLYFNTQVPAALQNPQVKGKPYLLATDITPIQYDQMACPYEHRVDSNDPIRRYKRQVNTHLFQCAALLLPWSSWAAGSLAHDYGVDPERIEVMPVGVDLERWHPADKTLQSKTRKTIRILFVGGDFKRKGGNLLLEAYRSLPASCAELVLVTRSAVPCAEGVTVYNQIQPNSAELIRLYQTSDIFVLPSYAEAFGISAVEASASGLPVIATSNGGLSDIVADQESGFLIPVGDVSALATRLRILVNHAGLRCWMGQAARNRAESLFDARKNAARLEDILVEIVSSRERR